MTEQLSKLEKLRAAAVDKASDRLVRTLTAQGVHEARALAFVEEHVTFDVEMGTDGFRVHVRAGDERARGTGDGYLEYFARELHCEHPEIGGTPVPFGLKQPPEYEAAIEKRAQVKAALAVENAAREARLQRDAAWRAETAKTLAAAHVEQHTDRVGSAF